MEIEQIIASAPDWIGQTWAQRIDAAASLLFVHGYITQTRRMEITAKLEQQFSKGLASGRIIKRGEHTQEETAMTDELVEIAANLLAPFVCMPVFNGDCDDIAAGQSHARFVADKLLAAVTPAIEARVTGEIVEWLRKDDFTATADAIERGDHKESQP